MMTEGLIVLLVLAALPVMLALLLAMPATENENHDELKLTPLFGTHLDS